VSCDNLQFLIVRSFLREPGSTSQLSEAFEKIYRNTETYKNMLCLNRVGAAGMKQTPISKTGVASTGLWANFKVRSINWT
jgi:hypothetical protein